MPQTKASDVQAPPAPPAAPSGIRTNDPVVSVPPVEITPEQATFLRARRDALSNQLESAQGRRNDVAESLRNDETQAAERPGLQERLRVLDERIIQLEKDIAANGQQLANAPAEAGSDRVAVVGSQSEDRGFFERANPNAVTFFAFLLLLPVAVRLSRRFIAPNRGPSRQEVAEMTAMRERMDKLDGAIDAVAVEVERIGEGQRFLTQAMSDNIPRMNGAAGKGGAFDPVPVSARDASERR
jgi:hypothetical protein